MNYIHLADLHLGKIIHGHNLLEDQIHVLGQVEDYVVKRSNSKDPLDMIIIAGDIFDRRIPPPEALDFFMEWTRRVIDRASVSIVAIPGNHDAPRRLGYGRAFMAPQGLYIITDIDESFSPIEIELKSGETRRIFAVPYLFPSFLERLAQHRISEGDENRLSQLAAYEHLVDHWKRIWSPNGDDVLVAHLFTLQGLESDSERPLVGGSDYVAPGLFSDFGYVALGHLHRPQQPAPHCWYPGSPLAYSFSEAGYQHSFLAVSLGRGQKPQVEAIPLEPLRPMARIGGTFEQLRTDPLFDQYRGSYLEITLSSAAPMGSAMALLQERFPHALHLRQEWSRSLAGPMDEVKGELISQQSLGALAQAFVADLGLSLESQDHGVLEGLVAEVEENS